MLKTFLHRIDRLAFEGPLAVLLGASGAFAVFAMPADLFGVFPGAPNMPFGKAVIAALVALLLGGVAYVAMRLPGRVAAHPGPALWEVDLDHDEEDEEEEERTVRMRRADRHPDAPPRQPIRASRDLGEPFMDVGAEPKAPAKADDDMYEGSERFVPWFTPKTAATETDDVAADEAPEPVVEAAPEAEPEGPVTATRWQAVEEDAAVVEPVAFHAEPEAPAPIAAEEVAFEDAAEPEPVVDEPDEVFAAFAPADEPTPTPSRPQRTGLTDMMARLSAGVDRRGGAAPSHLSTDKLAEAFGRPRAADDLRNALDELNRLARHRG